jgi:hypothetical protein
VKSGWRIHWLEVRALRSPGRARRRVVRQRRVDLPGRGRLGFAEVLGLAVDFDEGLPALPGCSRVFSTAEKL